MFHPSQSLQEAGFSVGLALVLAIGCSEVVESGPSNTPRDSGTVRSDSGAAEVDSAILTARDSGPLVQLVDSGSADDAGSVSTEPDGGTTSGSDAAIAMNDSGTVVAPGACCQDGDCLCHGEPPSAPTSSAGPYSTTTFTVAGAGCVHYPTNAEGPFAAIAISDGYLGSGGCGIAQTGLWGPFYASWGIVAMVISTNGQDSPTIRGDKLLRGIEALQAENQRAGSPLFGELAGRYGTSGFSMGGGGTTFAAVDNSSLLTNLAIMPYGPPNTRSLSVPTLVICGTSDTIAPCSRHGTPLYQGIPSSVPKMVIDIASSHSGQPTAGGGDSGEAGLAFQKVFLEGDERWIPILDRIMARDSTL